LGITLVQALGLETSRVISICGAGGKTSLMAALAREWASGNERVLATTTTKMGTEEAEGPWQPCQAADAADLLAKSGRHAGSILAYRVGTERGRLLGFPAHVIDEAAKSSRFTRILVEADGSRRRPLKAPAEHEPVFPAATDAIVMVAGASGLDRPLNEETVFRADRWSALTGMRMSDPVTPQSLARVVVDPDGLARGAPPRARRAFFLNQVDTRGRLTAAGRVLDCLTLFGGRGPERAAMGRLLPEPAICEVREQGPEGVQ
jgi:probable selenium-dependent hydroxylase accessory protein YqeC